MKKSKNLEISYSRSYTVKSNIRPKAVRPKFAPIEPKICKPGTGCIYQINDNLWEGSFYPRWPGGKRKKFNVYIETREQCEIKLAEMIEQVKAEIAEMKKTANV